ncbi:MAG: integral rane sensor signal transduction histidine kinase [Paenibacillus sp.]|nr:integral rane sensor signal transduction histidine kinase [Paenibacillus sp.]
MSIMKYGFSALLLLILLLILLLMPLPRYVSAADQTGAVQGKLDLSQSDLARETVKLTGEWELYWGELLEPADIHAYGSSPSPMRYAKVPHIWGTRSTFPPENEGAATYRLRIHLGDEVSPAVHALYVPAVATSYKLWINGELKASNGTVGLTRETMKPKNYAKVVYFHPDAPDVELVVQVSNFVQRKGGMWAPLYIGEASSITRLRENRMSSDVFISSALFILGLYHVGLWFFRKKDKLVVLIGCASLFFGLRTLLLGETLLVRFVPQLDWSAAVRLEYLSPNAGILLFALFVKHLYPRETSRRAIAAILVSCFVFCLLALLFEPRIFTYSMVPFQIVIIAAFFYILYVYALAIKRRREGALLSGVSVGVMFAAAMNDILFYNQLVSSVNLAPFGVFLFLFSQTMIVAKRFTGAHAKVEEIGAELLQVNMQLENTIAERTAELRLTNEHLLKKNEELRQAEESRRQLVSNISHELGTPMTAIQGYVKAIMDGIIEPTENKYWNTIYDKVLYVNRLVKDLFQLSRLEAKQFKFDFEAMSADDLIELHLSKLEWDVRSRGVLFTVKRTPPEGGWGDAYVMIDSVRIDQVVTNIVYNALKFTSAGGAITIESGQAGNELLIRITDTGTGIDEKSLPYVFDRFFKDSSDGTQEGTGLGLAIAKEIVLAHGGRIWAESKRNEGSSFYFTLPLIVL